MKNPLGHLGKLVRLPNKKIIRNAIKKSALNKLKKLGLTPHEAVNTKEGATVTSVRLNQQEIYELLIYVQNKRTWKGRIIAILLSTIILVTGYLGYDTPFIDSLMNSSSPILETVKGVFK